LSASAARYNELAAVGHNDRMIIVKDAVAEVHRDTHKAELKTMQRVFAEVKTHRRSGGDTGRRGLVSARTQ
jgi:nicotinamidase-related amidase